MLHFLQRNPLGFRHTKRHPDKLQNHHPAKEEEDEPGAKEATIWGKKVVISAAKIQWVAQPKDWPSARWRFGKISEINTQITAP